MRNTLFYAFIIFLIILLGSLCSCQSNKAKSTQVQELEQKQDLQAEQTEFIKDSVATVLKMMSTIAVSVQTAMSSSQQQTVQIEQPSMFWPIIGLIAVVGALGIVYLIYRSLKKGSLSIFA